MKIEAFDIFDQEDTNKLKKFVAKHKVIDIKLVGNDRFYSVIVMYEDNPKRLLIKYFNERKYQDVLDSYASMQEAVDHFCFNHDVVSVNTTQNADEDLVTVVTYKE